MIDDVRPPRPRKPKPSQKLHHRAAVRTRQLDKAMPKPDATIDLGKVDATAAKPVRFARVRHHWYNFSQAEKVMALGGVILICLSAIGCGYYLANYKEPRQTKIVIPAKKVPKPTTVASPLSGVQVDPALARRPVTAIMIENSLDARPQSGLQDAGVVFEAIAEGGITRFIALYQDSRPQYVGPVRSLRPYYIDFASSFDAAIAHVGGSPEALSQIRSGGKDLDQFFNSGSYWRQPTRDAPHNVYTSFDRLDALNQLKGYSASSFTPWPRKAEAKLKTPTAKSIDLNISSGDFNVHYDYNAASNSYLRSEGGRPHLVTASADDKTGVQLKPKVVIALVMDYGIESDGKHSQYQTNGSGQLYVFQDGGVQTGTWSKADRASQFVFTDDSGKPLTLNPGQTWVSIIQNGQISY
jgi:Protein of unknown function (DUF3048) N-terminal domain/Protein of unknown function (DUF3048) C-terminal domain